MPVIATPETLCRALGREPLPESAALVPFAWGGWMLCCETSAGAEGVQISNHGKTDGLRCEGLDEFGADADPSEVVALLLAAIAAGKTWGGARWRDVAYMRADRDPPLPPL